MTTAYYLINEGTLQRKDNTVEVVNLNNVKRTIPVERITDIYVMNQMNFNVSLLNLLGKHGICLHIFDYYQNYKGTYYPVERLISGKVLVKQVEHYQDKDKRITIAKKLIDGSTHNIIRNLQYYNRRDKDVSSQIQQIEQLNKGINSCRSIKELMGYEGNIRQIYYSSFNTIVNQEIDFTTRVKRPPDNMINALISFINSLVYTRILRQVHKTQLNPTISYLHEPSTRRFSLCLDIAEVFKPLIADRLIFSILNKNIITEDDFEKDTKQVCLKEKGFKRVITHFEQALSRTIKHKSLKRNVSYEHLIKLELLKLVKHVIGDKQYEPFKIWW